MAMEPPSSSSIYKVSRKIKQREQSLYNALRSIYHDSLFVGEIRSLWPELPLLANLRCGLWYAPRFDGTCYFKSTDGHTGNWSFNPSRLNMHVAMLAAQRGGCLVVDATRRGKRFPDSLSKTIPIWACVLNRALCKFSSQTWDCSLHLPLWVSDIERENIESCIDEWVILLNNAKADLASLGGLLKKPLQPLWISQRTVVWLNEVPKISSWSFTPIILVSASQPLPSAKRLSDGGFGWTYIPGGADDEESWARGLPPNLFWKHALSLISSSPDECNRMVADIVERDRVARAYRGLEAKQVILKDGGKIDSECWHSVVEDEQREDVHWIGQTGLAMGSLSCEQSMDFELFDDVINCGVESDSVLLLKQNLEQDQYLYLPVKDSKHDRFSLLNNLPKAIAFAKEKLRQGHKMLVFCSDGENLSACVCLAILVALFSDGESFDNGTKFGKVGVSKWDIRQRLVYLCKFVPSTRPSRGNLRQVYNALSTVSPLQITNASDF